MGVHSMRRRRGYDRKRSLIPPTSFSDIALHYTLDQSAGQVTFGRLPGVFERSHVWACSDEIDGSFARTSSTHFAHFYSHVSI